MLSVTVQVVFRGLLMQSRRLGERVWKKPKEDLPTCMVIQIQLAEKVKSQSQRGGGPNSLSSVWWGVPYDY